MAECSECGKKLGWLDPGSDGLCGDCTLSIIGKQMIDATIQQEETLQAHNEATSRIMLTTESNPNLNITKRIEIVTAECAYGMNIFKDLLAGVRNIVGGRSEAVQSTMRDARKTALYELKKEAHAVGANAVVGVDLDYVELAGSGSSMLMLVASGTAVVIEE